MKPAGAHRLHLRFPTQRPPGGVALLSRWPGARTLGDGGAETSAGAADAVEDEA